jgi:hypothetical protein
MQKKEIAEVNQGIILSCVYFFFMQDFWLACCWWLVARSNLFLDRPLPRPLAREIALQFVTGPSIPRCAGLRANG